VQRIGFSDRRERSACPSRTGIDCYLPAPEVEELARQVIKEHHSHLAEASICFVYRSGKWCGRGRTVTGKALIAPPLWRFLSGCELVLMISEVIFKNLNEEGKVALVDHELSHFNKPLKDKRGTRIWTIRDHDVCEFSDVVRRHNICMSNLRALTDDGMQQLDLVKYLAETVENPEAVAEVYSKRIEVEEEENLVCELEECSETDPL
jgi:predicted metallopeptidase